MPIGCKKSSHQWVEKKPEMIIKISWECLIRSLLKG